MVLGVELDSLKEVVERRTLNKMMSTMANCDLHIVFFKQRTVFSDTMRHRKSLVPRTIGLFNISLQGHGNVDWGI